MGKKKTDNPVLSWLETQDINMDNLTTVVAEEVVQSSIEVIAQNLKKIGVECEKLKADIDKWQTSGKDLLDGQEDALLFDAYERIERMRYWVRECEPVWRQDKHTPCYAAEPQMKNIEISSGQDYLLKITLFPLVRFPSKGGYNIYSDLKAALQKFLAEHPVNPAKDMRLTIVYRRIVPWELTLGKARCDNDNFEMRRCTNAITDALAISDSVDKISFFYTTEQVPHRNCVEVFLLNETHIVTQKMLRIFSQ